MHNIPCCTQKFNRWTEWLTFVLCLCSAVHSTFLTQAAHLPFTLVCLWDMTKYLFLILNQYWRYVHENHTRNYKSLLYAGKPHTYFHKLLLILCLLRFRLLKLLNISLMYSVLIEVRIIGFEVMTQSQSKNICLL